MARRKKSTAHSLDMVEEQVFDGSEMEAAETGEENDGYKMPFISSVRKFITIALSNYNIEPNVSRLDLIVLEESDAAELKNHDLTAAIEAAKQIGVRFRVAVEA
jgi:hypothetical protein